MAEAISSVARELERLAALRDQGALTSEEFATQKARVLGTSNMQPKPNNGDARSEQTNAVASASASSGAMRIGGLPLDDVMQAFLRRNVAYYRPIFVRMEREGVKFHANFVALFFAPVWLAYRRFYLALVVLYAVPAAAVVTKSLMWLLASPWPLPQLVLLGPFLASVTFCAFGNFFLYRRFRRLTADQSISGDQILARVEGRGGGSTVMLGAAIAASVILFAAYPLSVIGSILVNPPGSLD